jgi:hypothetical protein
MVPHYSAKAASPAHDENACLGLSPQAGLPATRTAIAWIGADKCNANCRPAVRFRLLEEEVDG